MTIVCSKCGKGFDSLIIDQETAWKQIYQKLLVHAKERHGGNLELLAQGITNACKAVTVMITVSELAVIPEDEKWIHEHIDTMQEIVMIAAGFDPSEDEDEEEEEDPVIPEGNQDDIDTVEIEIEGEKDVA